MNNFSRGGGFGAKKPGFGGGSRGGFGGGFGGNRGGFKPRFNQNDGEEREMFDATCGECGNNCQVPFRPNGRKPVLCSNCFRKDDNSRPSFGGNRPSYGDRPSYGEKRSFSNDRFNRGTEEKPNDERLQSIEAKLDVILSQLRRLNRDTKAEDVTPAPKQKKATIVDLPEIENLDLGE